MNLMSRVYLSDHMPLTAISLLNSEKLSSLKESKTGLTSYSTVEISIPIRMAVYLQEKNISILTNPQNLESLTLALDNLELPLKSS